MFLDLDLGDGTGLDVLRWMRERKRFVPTAVMTAFRPEFNPDDAIELGALAYVDQPLPIEVLVTLARGLTRPLSAFDDPNQLHCRFLAGDPGALDCLDAIFLKVLPRRLHRAFTRAPFDFAEDAVATACVEYGGRAAARYDPSRLPSVLDFVYAIAWRNLANRLHSEVARTNRERRWATESPVAQLPDSEGVAGAFDARLAVFALITDPRERKAAEVLLRGGTSGDIAAALGLAHLPPGDRSRACKQFRDRIIKRLSRYVRRTDRNG